MDDVLLYAIALVIAVMAASAFVRVARTSRDQRAAWGGLVAEGRCLRAWTKQIRDDDGRRVDRHHHAYEFMTQDGRRVNFEEAGGSPTVRVDDMVMIHYAPERPERATAIRPPTNRSMGTVLTTCSLVFLAALAGFCALFIVIVALKAD